MKVYEFYNPNLITFLNSHPDLDLESLIVDLLPFINKIIHNKNENIDNVKLSLKELFSDLQKENQNIIHKHNELKEQYHNQMNHCIQLLEEKQNNMKHIVEKNIKDNIQNLFSMLKEKDGVVKETIGTHIESFNQQSNQQYTKLEHMFQKIISETNNSLIQKLNEESEKSSSKIQGFLHNQIVPLQNSVNTFTNQFENSSKKGGMSENKLQSILTNIFPHCYIEDTSKLTSAGDFIIHHDTIGNILIENKCYSQNVRREEVEKFLRDVKHQNCHGVLISQHTGIVNKPNFHIETYNGFVNVYIHNMNYDPQLINNAFQVIEAVSNIHQDTDFTLKCSKKDLEKVLKEYTTSITTQQNVIISLQDNIKILKENNIPSLKQILENNLPSSTNTKLYICPNCKREFDKQSSLSQHKRFCKEIYHSDNENSS